jgi:uncharacterized repeat protein (TIGR02543 family)
MYSFEAKYGQNLSGIWPSYGEVESGASNIKIYGWYLGNYAATPHSDRLEMNSSLCDAAEAVGGAGDTSSTLYCAPQWRTTSAALVDHTRLYYVQVPAGTAPAVVVALDNASAWTLSSSPSDWPAYISYNGIIYQLYQGENGCQSGNTKAQSLAISGFTLLYPGNVPTLPNQPYSSLHIGKESDGVKHFDSSGTAHSSSKDVYQYIIFLYSRNSFTLSFNVQNPISTPIASSTVASGTALANYEPADPSYTGYVFGGWYTTPACLAGQEFDFTSGVMPAGNLALYAKWTPAAVSVKFYDSIHGTYLGAGTDLYTSQGGTVSQHTPAIYTIGQAYAGKGEFQGWVWLVADQYPIKFEFDQTQVTAPVENPVLKVYATWKTTGFAITYDANSAAGGSGSVPVDYKTYALNEEARVLDGSGLVAPTGKVFYGWTSADQPEGVLSYPYNLHKMIGSARLVAFYGDKSDSVEFIYHANNTNISESTTPKSIYHPLNQDRPLAGQIFTHNDMQLVGWYEGLAEDAPTPGDPAAVAAVASDAAGYYSLDEVVATGSSDTPREFYGVWQYNKYTIRFQVASTGGGSLSGTTSFSDIPHGTQWSASGISVPTPVPATGYEFDYWSPGIPADSAEITASLAYTAYFKLKDYTVTYAPGDHGTFMAVVHSSLHYGNPTPDAPTTAEVTGEAGYTFTGWSPNLANYVTGDVTYVAQWTANTDTKYTVEFYYQQADGNYPGSPTISGATRTATTGTPVEVTALDKIPTLAGTGYSYAYTGDSYVANVLEDSALNGDGSTVLKVYFKRQFTITYAPGDHGTWTVGTAAPYYYDSVDFGATTPAAPAGADLTYDAGYSLAGWSPSRTPNVSGSVEYVAQWIADTDTRYTVEFYFQGSDGSWPAAAGSSITRTGTTGGTATLSDSDKTAPVGYALDESQPYLYSATIAGDDSTVLKVYFKLALTVTYQPGTKGAWGANPTIEPWYYNGLDYGASLSAAAAWPTGTQLSHAPGYSFVGWDADNNGSADYLTSTVTTMPTAVTGNLTFTAIWAADTDTPYTVEYYYQLSDGTYPASATATASPVRTGTTDTHVEVTAADKIADANYSTSSYSMTFDASNANNVLSDSMLNGDGSTVLKLYFKRQFTITYAPGEAGTWATSDGTYTPLSYNDSRPVFSLNPADDANHLPGWEFVGWSDPLDDAVTATRTYIALWQPVDVSYLVEYYLVNGTTVSLAEAIPFSQPTGTYVQADMRLTDFPGYTLDINFSGSLLDGRVLGDGSLVLRLYYLANTSTPWRVQYLVSGSGALLAEDSFTGTTGLDATAPIRSFSGYEYDATNAGNLLTGLIAGDGSLILRVYYSVVDNPPVPPVTPDPPVTPVVDVPETITPLSTIVNPTVDIANTITPLGAVPDIYSTIDETGIPLIGSVGHWALLNLILAVLGALIAIILLIAFFVQRKRETTEESEDVETLVTDRKRMSWRVAILMLAAIAVIVFLLTEDTTLKMAWTDTWTVLHIVLFIIQCICAGLSMRRKQDEQKQATSAAGV